MFKIGIVGNGFVGNAIYQNFKFITDVFVYDIQESKRYNTIEEVLNSDFIFICLPTPMITSIGGECDLTIINDFFDNLPVNLNSIFIIKSTIPIGTTRQISNKRFDLKIVHSPEFLTAKNAVHDFANPTRNVIGGPKEIVDKVYDLYKYKYGPSVPTFLVSSDESETIKYFSNSFLALKVTYFNMLWELSNKLNMSYDRLLNGITSDHRIGSSHTQVPGFDGHLGYGGTCFPKDINSLISILEKNNINNSILKSSWEYNKEIRGEWDWATNPSAVSINKKE